jgi:Eukaryotic translation initiation factor eIF2A
MEGAAHATATVYHLWPDPCWAFSTHYLFVHPVITLVCVFLLQGTRFAILHGDGPKPNLSVYEMKDVRSAVKAVQPVVHNPSRAANVIHWSPTGKNMVLAGLKVNGTWAHVLHR